MGNQKLFEIQFDFPRGPYYYVDEDWVPKKVPQTSTGKQIFQHAKSSFDNNSDLKIISYKMGRCLVGRFNGKPKYGRSLRMLASCPTFMTAYDIEARIDSILRNNPNPIYPEYHAISRMSVTPRKNNYRL